MRLPSLATLILVVLGSTHALDVPIIDGIVCGVVTLGVGVPPTIYSLLVDPGSSNTWLGAKKSYVKTKSSLDAREAGHTVALVYGSGTFSGEEYFDNLTMSGISFQQEIGVTGTSKGVNEDGIFGIGPTDLTRGTLSHNDNAEIPTVTDSLFKQRLITSRSVTIGNHLLTFEPTKAADVNYVPITRTSPANEFWGLDAGFRYCAVTLLAQTAGIIDHGTTLLLLSTNAFNTFRNETGAELDASAGILRYKNDNCLGLKPLTLVVGGKTIEISSDLHSTIYV